MFINLESIIEAGGVLSEMKGRLIRRKDNRNGRNRYGEKIVRVVDATHFETHNDFYHIKDVYVIDVTKEELQKLLDRLETIQSDIHKKLLYCKERSVDRYNEIDVIIEKSVQFAKKNKISDGISEIRKLVDVFLA